MFSSSFTSCWLSLPWHRHPRHCHGVGTAAAPSFASPRTACCRFIRSDLTLLVEKERPLFSHSRGTADVYTAGVFCRREHLRVSSYPASQHFYPIVTWNPRESGNTKGQSGGSRGLEPWVPPINSRAPKIPTQNVIAPMTAPHDNDEKATVASLTTRQKRSFELFYQTSLLYLTMGLRGSTMGPRRVLDDASSSSLSQRARTLTGFTFLTPRSNFPHYVYRTRAHSPGLATTTSLYTLGSIWCLRTKDLQRDRRARRTALSRIARVTLVRVAKRFSLLNVLSSGRNAPRRVFTLPHATATTSATSGRTRAAPELSMTYHRSVIYEAKWRTRWEKPRSVADRVCSHTLSELYSG